MTKTSLPSELVQRLRSDRRLLFNVVSKAIPISTFMGPGRMFLCPFHADGDPSAKLHDDDDYERLHCFSCRKQYTSYHYLRTVKDQKPFQVLINLAEPKDVIDAVSYFDNVDTSWEEDSIDTEALEVAYKEGLPALLKHVYWSDDE